MESDQERHTHTEMHRHTWPHKVDTWMFGLLYVFLGNLQKE